MAVRAVVFDLFDTLVDLRFEDLERLEHKGKWLPASVTALHETVARHISLDLAAFLEELHVVDRAMREIQVEEGREISTRQRFATLAERLELAVPGLPDVLTEVHMGALRSVVAVPEHHVDLLDELGGRVKIGLCSNFTDADTALAVLDGADFRRHLDAVVISETVGWRKPRKEIFEAVLEELDVAPDEVLHVGDSLRADVAGAAPLGMHTAWITRRVRDPEKQLREHDGPPPDHQVSDLVELLDLLP